jgi:hypothetical protein
LAKKISSISLPASLIDKVTCEGSSLFKAFYFAFVCGGSHPGAVSSVQASITKLHSPIPRGAFGYFPISHPGSNVILKPTKNSFKRYLKAFPKRFSAIF